MNKEEKEVTEEILSEDVTSEVNIEQEEVEAAPELSETFKIVCC